MAEESARVRAVMLKVPAASRELRMRLPRFPEAWSRDD